MEPEDLFFRREAGRSMPTLTRLFGGHNLALADDAKKVVHEDSEKAGT